MRNNPHCRTKRIGKTVSTYQNSPFMRTLDATWLLTKINLSSFHTPAYSIGNGCYFLLIFRIFLIDSLNFSFWTDDGIPEYVVTFKGQAYTGYSALCAAIKRAIGVACAFRFIKFFYLIKFIFTQSEQFYTHWNIDCKSNFGMCTTNRWKKIEETNGFLGRWE